MASRTYSYSVVLYYYYVPKTVLESTAYQLAYFNKHKIAHTALTMEMIIDTYSALKCNVEANEQDEFNEHCRLVHGVIPAHLRRWDLMNTAISFTDGSQKV